MKLFYHYYFTHIPQPQKSGSAKMAFATHMELHNGSSEAY